jgi:drug/metabolite transporter (DMT)-like permease
MRTVNIGVLAALGSAILFGISTPIAKLLLTHISPWLLAALLYLGSGIGLWLVCRIRRTPSIQLARCDWAWLASATIIGGMIAPVLLMAGLSAMPATSVSLLLNAESVFTALLAWFAFKENVDRRIALGMLLIVIGASILSWPKQGAAVSNMWPALLVLAACFAWALDNNLTRKVSLADASFIAMIKGLVAGGTNLAIALTLFVSWPDHRTAVFAGLLGFFSYGMSLTLFIIALRHLGTARTGAYFSVAPFCGALLAVVLLDEPVSAQLIIASVLMMIGVGLHLSERHIHRHRHVAVTHNHPHHHAIDDLHHDHPHDPAVPPNTTHTHEHQHAALNHAHAHFPDAHHQHIHNN